MTYRERREARADRLRDWAETRQTRAASALAIGTHYRDDHAFNTQPGHIPERARLIAREDRAFASIDKANAMASKADEIERQAEHAIYSDDPDAVERLADKLAALEARREHIKTTNAVYRKTHKAELAAITNGYDRDCAMPYRAYELQNLGGNITRARQRLAQISALKG